MHSRAFAILAVLAAAAYSAVAGCSSNGAQTVKTITIIASSASHPSPSPSSSSPSPSPTPVVTTPATQQQQQNGNGCAPLTPTEASAVGSTIIQYFDGITGGNYAQAWNSLTARNQSTMTYSRFVSELETSRDLNVTYRGEFVSSQCQPVAEVTFTSYQAPQYAPNGTDTCDNWNLDYYMALQPGGYYLIDSAQPANDGGGWTTC